MMKTKKMFKKRKWTYYLCVFAVFTVLFFLVSLMFDKHNLRYSIISGLVGGVVFTVLWFFFDQGEKQIQASAKEDEAVDKRKEDKE